MEAFFQISRELEPLFLTGTSLGVAVLALAVYRSNKHSATNIIFILLSLSILSWLWAAYMAGLAEVAQTALIFHRLAIFFAAPMSALFFLFAHTIPNNKLQIKKSNLFIIITLTLLMMIINISPYAFVGTSSNGTTNPVAGPGLVPFGVISSVFSLLAVYYIFKKYSTPQKKERAQFRIILTGVFTMLFLVIGTILIPIIVFQSGAFLPFLSIYTIIFLGMTAYAITEYQLFNIKIILTQTVTVVIWITLFSKIFFAQTLIERGADSLIFLITVIFGISLIRSVRNEIQQKEKIQKQEKEMEIVNQKLAQANDRQEGLIHFISHQVKGYLTKGRNTFSVISDGDYGQITPDLKNLVDRALKEMSEGVSTVMNILDASNLKKGTTTYKMEQFDLKKSVDKIVDDLKSVAISKGLKFDFDVDDKQTYMVNGDEEQISKHVLRNLIDNAVEYTEKGNIQINLSKRGEKTLFSVKDSGVGIADEDRERLFTEGGKGANSMKVNVNSTGYGLYIAKEIVLAHHGRIWYESEGKGKGTQFFVEI